MKLALRACQAAAACLLLHAAVAAQAPGAALPHVVSGVVASSAERAAATAAPSPAHDPATQLEGYREASGAWRIKPQFSKANAFQGGLAFIEYPNRAGVGLIDQTGELVVPNVEPAIWFSETVMTAPGWSEGLLAARDIETDKVGFVDPQGRWIIKPRFRDAHEFHEGLAAVRLRENGPVGFIDKRGAVVIGPRFGTNFRVPPVFSEGLAAVGLNDDWPRTNQDPPGRLGYIDRKGRWAVQPRFESGEPFFAGKAKAVLKGREVVLTKPLKR